MRDTLIAYPHGNDMTSSWHKSMFAMVGYDSETSKFIAQEATVKTGGMKLPEARNTAAQCLLESGLEWMLFIDTDMGFQHDTLERLREVADPETRPIVGGLAFAVREVADDGYNGKEVCPTPTIFDWHRHPDGVMRMTGRTHYPPNTLLSCDGTGTAILLIHRSVIEQVFEEYGPNWFTRLADDGGDLMGEDISFFVRTGDLGIPCHVHTGVRTTHNKGSWWGEHQFWRSIIVPHADLEVDVLVPVMNRPHNAEPFMQSLRASTGLAKVTAIANSDDTETVAAWEAAGADVLLTPRTTFAEKINAGYRETTRPLLFITGDDVRFHPGWLDHAQFMLHAYKAAVVGTNDTANIRVIRGEHATHMLIAREYVDKYGASFDGPGVVCHEGYRHWYVDDEIVAAARQRGVFQAAHGSIVEHLHPIFGTAESDPVYELGQSHAAADAETWRARAAEHLALPPAGGPVPLSSSGGSVFTGTVADGHGAATRDFADGAYGGIRFGFDPYPGTLNIHCDDTPQLGEPVHQFTIAGQTISLWPGVVDGAPVWIQTGDARPGWIIELISPHRLRDTYETGDDLTVTLIGQGR